MVGGVVACVYGASCGWLVSVAKGVCVRACACSGCVLWLVACVPAVVVVVSGGVVIINVVLADSTRTLLRTLREHSLLCFESTPCSSTKKHSCSY